MIPNTSIAMVILEDLGVMFYDMESLMTIGIISLIEIDDFLEQQKVNIGAFKIFTAVGEWPYSIHFITNYGIFIIDYPSKVTE
jgi:hypothetical protein